PGREPGVDGPEARSPPRCLGPFTARGRGPILLPHPGPCRIWDLLRTRWAVRATSCPGWWGKVAIMTVCVSLPHLPPILLHGFIRFGIPPRSSIANCIRLDD